MEIQEILHNKREIFIWGDIGEETALQFVQEIRSLQATQTPITIFIHSDGGEIESMASIIDEIRIAQKESEVFIVAHGKAYSAAALILASAAPGYAFATSSSTIMLHPCSYELDSDYADIQKKFGLFTEKVFEKYVKMVSLRTKKTIKKIAKDIKDGLWLTAEQAMKYGIIDGIWNS